MWEKPRKVSMYIVDLFFFPLFFPLPLVIVMTVLIKKLLKYWILLFFFLEVTLHVELVNF